MSTWDDAVVGAGVIGLATAYHLARRGRRVVVIERSRKAEGASVRNFGMLWPIGQPLGAPADLALHSVDIWRELLTAAGLWFSPCGSLHLAHADDEAQVLHEFMAKAQAARWPATWWDADTVHRNAPLVNPVGLRGGMFSATEICVDPRQVMGELPAWLAARYGIEFHFETLATDFEDGLVRTTTGNFRAERLWVCTGADLALLYPEVLSRHALRRCKLQMLRTTPLPPGSKLGPMLAGGLTLQHYAAFAQCPSLPALKERFNRELPEHLRYGIHVMAAQNGAGELILGDSHEYDEEIQPFDRADIEALILEYLSRLILWPLPNAPLAFRWHGVYLKYLNGVALIERPAPNVVVFNGVGGAGMTLSQGLAERLVTEILKERG